MLDWGVCAFFLKLSAIIVRLAKYFHSAWTLGCPTSMKSVTHQQARWFVIALPVQAIHYTI